MGQAAILRAGTRASGDKVAAMIIRHDQAPMSFAGFAKRNLLGLAVNLVTSSKKSADRQRTIRQPDGVA